MMGRIALIAGIVLCMLCFGCQENDIPADDEPFLSDQITDGFCLTFGDSIIITHEDIEYYDFSTHMVYLKEPHPFFEDQFNLDVAYMPFSVHAFKEEAYSGILFPAWSSSIPTGPFIDYPSFYPGYAIKINYRQPMFNTQPDTIPDPREGQQIVDALKKYDQYHIGLSCGIDNVSVTPGGVVSFSYTITNEDEFNYYVLNPDKMGIGLFHYFTNGLYLYNQNTGWLKHQIPVISPEPWDSWEMGWMELLESQTSRSFQIVYQNYDHLPPAQYDVSFRYPGLHHVEQIEFHRTNGRIWLGELELSGKISVE